MTQDQVILLERVQACSPDLWREVWALIDQVNKCIAPELRVTAEHHAARATAANDLLMELVTAMCHTGGGHFQHGYAAIWQIVFEHLVREGYLVQVDRVNYQARTD